MSLARAALRLSAMGALTAGGHEDRTMAGQYVYDSQQDAVQKLTDDPDPKPLILVYTDDTTVDPGDERRGTEGPSEHYCDLIIELWFAGTIQGEMVFAETDGTLELALDIFEAQVRHALMKMAPDLWAERFVTICQRVDAEKSERYYNEEAAGRVAARILTLTCRVKETCTGEVWANAFTGEDRTIELPEPLKTTLQTIIDEGKTGSDIVAHAEQLTALWTTLMPVLQRPSLNPLITAQIHDGPEGPQSVHRATAEPPQT